ncbi:leucine-rich repeat protein [Terrisporobacter glycolicus]|uniref:Fibronectin type-III domain-containing protein n=1 Tax=Terrisporobacter glycolicus ATCC 14880 = DSM 1288 TaxID=1121315 RepID=A0ABZ2EQR1_9FIRM|nr:leucine-rich repeat protein [Terrisporobacter glycolicus]
MNKKIVSLSLAISLVMSNLNFACISFADETNEKIISEQSSDNNNSIKLNKLSSLSQYRNLTSYEDYSYGFSDSGITIKGYLGRDTSISIPSEINGIKVVAIENGAFRGCSSLTSVEIPDSVTSIGESAFRECSSLTSIKIPKGVTSISTFAFYECSSLTSVEIPKGVTNIEDYAFSGCSSLTSIEIPEGVTIIGACIFDRCSSLTSIEIPDSVTSIDSSSFYRCSSLTNIKIPQGVTSIKGDVLFSECDNLLSINVDENNQVYKSIDGILYSKNGKELIVVPQRKTNVTIAQGVTSIADYAFSECSSLTSVEIPKGVTSIGESAFSGCSSLKSVEIPEGVTSIGYYAFSGCSSLKSVEISYSVISIGNEIFSECNNLLSINVDENNQVYKSIDGILYSKSGKKLLLVPKGKTSVEIPKGVTNIEDDAFSYCSRLTSIEIPEGVESIGVNAFVYCSSLTSIKIPRSVTNIGYVANINNCVFMGCDSLTIYAYIGSYAEYYAERCSILFKALDATDISSSDVTVKTIKNQLYTGKQIKPEVILNQGNKTLQNGTDYKLSYTNNINVGEATITVEGIGHYSGYRKITFKIIPKTVTNVKASSSSYSSNKVTWSSVSGASGYEVYRATSKNGTYSLIKTVESGDTLSYTNTSLITGKSYYYKVRAYSIIENEKVFGDYSEIVSAKPSLSKPTAKSTPSTYSSNKVTWNKISGASGYEVYVATSKSGTYTLKKTITSGSTLSYANTGLTTGKTYYYKVRAYRTVNGKKVYSSYSSIVSAKPSLSKPTTKVASSTYSSNKVTWNKISGASGYEVYRATSKSGTYSKVKTITSGSTLSYTNKSLTTGKTYYYKVRAYRTVNGKKVYSSYSSVVSVKPSLSKPSITLSTATKKAYIKWNKISGASGYEIYRATSKSGTYSKLKTITSGNTVSYTNSKLTSQKTYYYKIRAYRVLSGKKVYSSYSSVKSIKVK